MLRSNHMKSLVSVVVFAILIAVAYSNTIHFPFVFDDLTNITDNKFIKISNLQAKDLSLAASNGQSAYRWIPNISFAVQYYYSALKTPAYHYFNISVHVLCATVLYFLLLLTLEYADTSLEINKKIELAFVATILWSLHPLQTNAVTYIVQRMTSLAALFSLAAVFLYALGRRPAQSVGRRSLLFIACAVSGLFALLSKENAAMLPATIIAYEFFFISPDRFLLNRRRIALALGGATLFLLVLGWLWLGRDIFDQIMQGYQQRYFSLPERLLTEPRVIFLYLGLLLFPTLSRLNINHDIPISTSLFSPPATILAIGGILLLLYAIIYLFKKDRILSFAILWFLLNLLIESSIIPLELCFEHRLYLPSTMLLFALVLAAYRFAHHRQLLLRAGLVILALGLGLLTWNRNLAWQSNVALWSDAQRKSPELIRVYINLGNALMKENDLARAETVLLQALEIDGRRKADHSQPAWITEMSGVHEALALVYQAQNNFPLARRHSDLTLQLEPNSVSALLIRGIGLTKEGEYQAAYDLFEKLAAGGADTIDLHNNWGICAYNLGQTDRAIFFFQRALKLDPNHAESHYNLGVAYSAKGMIDEARREMAWGMQL